MPSQRLSIPFPNSGDSTQPFAGMDHGDASQVMKSGLAGKSEAETQKVPLGASRCFFLRGVKYGYYMVNDG